MTLPRFDRSALCVTFALLMPFVIGCGKKGPPLAPIVRIPAAITSIEARRSGDDVFVTLTVPARNIDASTPVDIGRIDIFGYTGRVAPARQKWAEVGDLVATVPVIPPQAEASAVGPVAPSARESAPLGATPGTTITVRDTLTPDELVQGRVDAALEPGRGGGGPPPPAPSAPQSPLLHRFYVAFGFSSRGRPGPPGTAAELPLSDVPAPPAFVRASYTETSVLLEWPPSDGIVGFLFDRPLGPEDSPLDEDAEPRQPLPGEEIRAVPDAGADIVPAGPVRYNVYRETAPSPLDMPETTPAPTWNVTLPPPLNSTPLDATSFTDSVELDRARCYVIRAVRGTSPDIVEGDASPPTCFTPTDIFPPAAPLRLAAVADEGGISLIWEPNGEADLAGYLILRGESSDATLQPLTSTPIVESRYRDTHVTAGSKYVYAVVAVDAHLPMANVSLESNQVEEIAR